MKKIKKKLKLLIFLSFIFLLSNISHAEKSYLSEGKLLFEKKKYDEAKFKFEQVIVRNPKDENAYLYLSKIFKQNKKIDQEEINLDTVILLNPKNEEAIYNLALLNIKKSNFKKTNQLLEQFKNVCKITCEKANEIKVKLNNSLKK